MITRFLRLIATALILSTGLGVANESAPKPQAAGNSTPSALPTPPPVVAYEKLMAFLPEPPADWTAEKPSGSINDIEVFKLSTATRTYQKGDDDTAPVTTVSIIDAGGHQGYFDITTNAWKTTQSPEGYDKVVEVDGLRGFEHSSTAAKTSSLCVVIGKRYFIQIEATNQDPLELKAWLRKIDLKKLAELK